MAAQQNHAQFRAQPATAAQRAAAWSVHAYTASGTVIAFFGVTAVFAQHYRAAFLAMLAATFVDATDGVLARMARVKDRTPHFDGAHLDDIVDYLTFVFLPILLVYQARLLPEPWGFAAVAAVLLSSAYGFCAADAKTDDHFFTGFPSYWNIVALYLYIGRLPAAANGAILLVLSALVFVRIAYVYPTRTPVLRGLTIALCAVWTVMILAIMMSLPDVRMGLVIASLFFPVYYTVLSLVLNARRVPAGPSR